MTKVKISVLPRGRISEMTAYVEIDDAAIQRALANTNKRKRGLKTIISDLLYEGMVRAYEAAKKIEEK